MELELELELELLLLRVLVPPALEKPLVAFPGLVPGAFRWTGFPLPGSAAVVAVLLVLVVLAKLEALVFDR